jgi:hypothetical protein
MFIDWGFRHSEGGGVRTDTNVRTQKAKGSFSKLRNVWLSISIIRLGLTIPAEISTFYGCETWLVTNEIRRKIQTFVNRCLRYILRIWWQKIISNRDFWKATGVKDINLEIRKRKFRWICHTLRKEVGEIPKAALLLNLQGSRKRGRPRNSWRRSVIKEVGRSWNELRVLAADIQKWKEFVDNLRS